VNDSSPAVEVAIVGSEHLATCQEIRRAVFVAGQGVPEELELDGLDGACTHFLLWRDGVPVGTARMRVVAARAKAERVAVLTSATGCGLGARLMAELECAAAERGLTGVVLHAQETVIPFYEKRGYRVEGEFFVEAGIRHRTMSKAL
jgi:predicted GNAT family N-acyltransferase